MDQETKQGFQKIEKEIESLALMVKGGFDAVDARFEQVDKRFDKIDQRFDRLEDRVGSLEATLKTQYPDKSYLDDKLADLAAEIGARINQRKDRDNKFKLKVIEILKSRALASSEDVHFLESLLD